jgi:hypothetical protein
LRDEKVGMTVLIMDRIPDINIEDYNYKLPEERIAQFPVNERDKFQRHFP